MPAGQAGELVPEGDTLHRIAATLAPALEGQVIEGLEVTGGTEAGDGLLGRRVERVEARGKHLLIHVEGGAAIHTHLGMPGVWHLYGPGERWRRSRNMARVVLEVRGWTAVCFRAPTARILRRGALRDDPRLRDLGPDLLASEHDAGGALSRMKQLATVPLGDALLDQRAVSGIGNVFKSEVMFRQKLDPFAAVAAFSDDELSALIADARALLQKNVDPPGAPRAGSPGQAYRYRRTTREAGTRDGGRHHVYGRAGRRCYDCLAEIEVARQAQGRSTYYCPRCQPPRESG